MKCFITPRQRALLAHQRTRVLSASTDSLSDPDKGSEDKFDVSQFEQVMRGFEPQTDFELKLLQGVLYREGHGPKSAPRSNDSHQRNRSESSAVSELDLTNNSEM
mmetsp:Transcript_6507/g.8780  ORF Transcript_6507/g.8780 Transcript_6507/m.8780 type:complete len:105 (+) Transcript_6507:226-540(+)